LLGQFLVFPNWVLLIYLMAGNHAKSIIACDFFAS
jgi:hypothetical protein